MSGVWSGESLAGSLLIATSALENTEFARSVVYVCTHSRKEGAIGVAVNCALPDPAVKDVWSQLDFPVAQARKDICVSLGGPVDPMRAFVLHSSEWTDANDLEMPNKGVALLTPALEILHIMSLGEGPEKAMVLLGHTGWDPGQLEEEIMHQNAWLITKANENIIFDNNFDCKWRDALASLGVDPLGLSTLAGKA